MEQIDTMAGQKRPFVPLTTIFLAYFTVGLTAFGFAILQKLKRLVTSRRWLSEEEMNEGLAMVQLYPGPIMINFTAYAGYKLRGVGGALMATVGFITPTFVLMLILSAVYFNAGSLSWVQSVFLGVEALVVGVLLNVTLEMGQRGIKGKFQAVIALAAFAAVLFKLNAVLVVLLALALGAIFIQPQAGAKGGRETAVSPTSSTTTQNWRGIAIAILVVIAVAIAAAVAAIVLDSDVGKMGLSFFKIGTVAFGNGITILPLIQSDAVEASHWLTMKEFADGIALSQITPGPFLIISAFVGYKLGGVGPALLATFAMFAPSFVMTLIFTEIFGVIGNNRAVKGALNGVLAGFVGLLIAVLLQLGKLSLTSPATLVLAGLAFVGVRYFKLDILWVFAGGLLIWGGLLLVGLV